MSETLSGRRRWWSRTFFARSSWPIRERARRGTTKLALETGARIFGIRKNRPCQRTRLETATTSAGDQASASQGESTPSPITRIATRTCLAVTTAIIPGMGPSVINQVVARTVSRVSQTCQRRRPPLCINGSRSESGRTEFSGQASRLVVSGLRVPAAPVSIVSLGRGFRGSRSCGRAGSCMLAGRDLFGAVDGAAQQVMRS